MIVFMANFRVLDPDHPLYQRGLSEFWNYVLATPPNREQRTQPGNLFFIRAHKLEDGLPVVRIGNEGIMVRRNQKIFIPVMVSVADSQNHNAPTLQDRRRLVRIENDQSEPAQEMIATIDGQSIFGQRDPEDFYLESETDFTLSVPRDSPYSDPSMSDLDVVFSYPGDFPAIANGTVVIIYDLVPRNEPYTLIIDAIGRGNYRATAYIDIKVVQTAQEVMQQFSLTDTFEQVVKARSVSISDPDANRWMKYAGLADAYRKDVQEKKIMRSATALGIDFSKISNKKKNE
jgi:hypothetical protein